MRSTVPRWVSLRCAALLLALAGLLAMHGLGEHGTHDLHAGMDRVSGLDGTAALVASTGQASAHAGHGPHVRANAADSTLLSWAPSAPAGSGMPMAAGSMCLAVLGLLLLAAAWLALRRPTRPLWVGSSRPARVPAPRGRAPDPPGLFVLSVQRC